MRDRKENNFINIIKTILGNQIIGDDCAHLKDLGVVVTQDAMVEGVHFSLDYTDAFRLGAKAVSVNISDVFASGAEPKYLTISLSLPKNIDENFITEFYKGAKSALQGAEIIGGDITGADKIFISICAIGKISDRNISSRKNAQSGFKIITNGEHGNSAAGLLLLQEGLRKGKFVDAHLSPIVDGELSKIVATSVIGPYAMMDTSDGLADALVKIANESKCKIEIDFSKIPYDKDIEHFDNWKDLVLYGGEDYKLVCAVPTSFNGGIEIGKVTSFAENGVVEIGKVTSFAENGVVEVDFKTHTEQLSLDKTYNHFGENK